MKMAFEQTARELLASGYSIRFRASGDSMHPTIRSGELVEVAPPNGKLPAIGDVVLFKAQRGLTAHRVVRSAGHSFVTRGDNAVGNDPAADTSALLGIVTGVERDGLLAGVSRSGVRSSRTAAAVRELRRRLFTRFGMVGRVRQYNETVNSY